ncbi:MAG: hypothetical protein JXR10_09285 [Cyclobacteriaceae bacterium]
MISLSSYAQQRTKEDSLFLNADLSNIETISTVSGLDPNKSAMLSAVLPGLGQIYNNQAWKVPLIYGGGIIIGHYINYNNKIYNEMRNSLIAQADSDPSTINPYTNFSETALTRNRDYFRRNRDLLMLIAGAFYLLNVVDAHVSAHLHEFEVNDNLTMKVSPTIQSTPLNSRNIGVSLSFRIK